MTYTHTHTYTHTKRERGRQRQRQKTLIGASKKKVSHFVVGVIVRNREYDDTLRMVDVYHCSTAASDLSGGERGGAWNDKTVVMVAVANRYLWK